MPTLSLCPECGAAIPAATRRGLCPNCLFHLGLAALAESGFTSTIRDSNDSLPASGTTANSAMGATSPATRRLGDYELLEEIARGGMGVVYRARQVRLDRIVAVKVIVSGQFASREQALRFRMEAEVAARLQHPNIVRIYETGEHEGQPYFSMDHVGGGNLASLVRSGPVPIQQAAILVQTLAEAIHYAHEQGVLHRDLKPSNVLLDEAGQPRITDFGLARRVEKDSFLTVTGQVLGSPNFMPPEQAGAKLKAGRPSDVYALGGILFYLLTGRPPFVAGTVTETLQQVLTTDPVSPQLLNASVPLDLATICLKCLEKELSRRYQTAKELAEELDRFLKHEPIHARPIRVPEKLWRWCRRKPALAALMVLLNLVGAVGVVGIVWQWQRAERNAGRFEAQSYASDMKLAQQAVGENNLDRALNLLNRHRPTNGLPDPRGWEWRYLWARCRGDELITMGRHDTDVRSIAFSGDGRWLASGDYRGKIKLWDVSNRVEAASCVSPGIAFFLRFSHDDRGLVSAGYDHGLRVWNLANLHGIGSPLQTGDIRGVTIHGQTIAAIDLSQQRLGQWDLWSGREADSYPIQQERDHPAVFSPDGRYWAGTSNATVTLWGLNAKAQLAALRGHESPPNVLAFSPDSRLLASGEGNGTVKLWDVAERQEIAHFPGHQNEIGGGSFSPDGRILATASFDHTIKLWDLATRRELNTLRGHLGEVYSVAFAPDGATLASSSADGTIKFWKPVPKSTENSFRSLPADLKLWSLSPDGQWLFLIFTDHSASLVDLVRWHESPRRPLGSTNIVAVSLRPDGGAAALGAGDGTIRLVETATLHELGALGGFEQVVVKVAWSANDRVLAAECSDHRIKAWNLETKREISNFQLRDKILCERLLLSADGGTLVAPFLDSTTEVWDLVHTRKRATLRNERLSVTGSAFFRDGKRMATSGTDRTSRIWSLVTERPLVTMFSDQTGLRSVALSPDERRLAAGDHLGKVRKVKLWDLALGQEVVSLAGHKEAITDIAFWPDGNAITSVSKDSVYVWRAPSFAAIRAAE